MSIEDEAGLHRNAEMYIQTSSEMSNAQSQTKDIREKRKNAKEYIINSMKTANLQSLSQKRIAFENEANT